MAPRLGSPQVTGPVNRQSNFSTYLYFFSHFWKQENKFYSEKLKDTFEKKWFYQKLLPYVTEAKRCFSTVLEFPFSE